RYGNACGLSLDCASKGKRERAREAEVLRHIEIVRDDVITHDPLVDETQAMIGIADAYERRSLFEQQSSSLRNERIQLFGWRRREMRKNRTYFCLGRKHPSESLDPLTKVN